MLFFFGKLLFHKVIDLIVNAAGKALFKLSALSCQPQTFFRSAKICSSAGLSSRKIQRDLSLGRLHRSDKLLLGLHLTAAEAHSHRDLSYACHSLFFRRSFLGLNIFSFGSSFLNIGLFFGGNGNLGVNVYLVACKSCRKLCILTLVSDCQ